MQQLTVIEGAMLVTLDADLSIIDGGELWIEDGNIHTVCEAGAFNPPDTADVTRIDASNRIAMPGFVNAHMHSYAGLLKGTVDTFKRHG